MGKVELGEAVMPDMFNLADIFLPTVNSFNNCRFPQDNLVVNEYDLICFFIVIF
jgi:hypothetical protein